MATQVAVGVVVFASPAPVAWAALVIGAVVTALIAARALSGAGGSEPQRLRRLADVLAAVETGDLTAATGSSARDGLGEVERAVDDLVARMRVVVGTVQQGLTMFHTDRLIVAGINQKMLGSAEMVAGTAFDVGVSAGQVADSINVVAASTEELAATVNEIARHATLAADTAVTAAAQGKQADVWMRSLGKAVLQVEGLAQVIANIAAQTHLLALNATIEAARAGDAGLGFAVVAGEVKALSRATAEATERVKATLEDIQTGSGKAVTAIQEITETMDKICANTASIASSVVQQSATTREIGRVSETAALEAASISGRVAAVHESAREIAYIGANNDATKSKSFELLERSLGEVVDPYEVGDFLAVFQAEATVVVDQADRNRQGTTTEAGVTRIMDYVEGPELEQFTYTGDWLHGDGLDGDPGGDAYSCREGDALSLRFVGKRIRYWAYAAGGQGIAEVWVDGQPRADVDLYSPDRGRRMLWESDELSAGEHTFNLVVSGRKNVGASYFWISVAMVDIVR
ncbi:MAG: methyl-accepting chemotaxis protein [Pseudonocardiales bacterium]|nr:methyl-accepting chemotaxis protein [Pseudonocardiales bacterium]